MRSASASMGTGSLPDAHSRSGSRDRSKRPGARAIRSCMRLSFCPRPIQDQSERERQSVVLAFADRVTSSEATPDASGGGTLESASAVLHARPGVVPFRSRVPARAARPAVRAFERLAPLRPRYAASIAIFSVVRLFAGASRPSPRTARRDGAASDAPAAMPVHGECQSSSVKRGVSLRAAARPRRSPSRAHLVRYSLWRHASARSTRRRRLVRKSRPMGAERADRVTAGRRRRRVASDIVSPGHSPDFLRRPLPSHRPSGVARSTGSRGRPEAWLPGPGLKRRIPPI